MQILYVHSVVLLELLHQNLVDSCFRLRSLISINPVSRGSIPYPKMSLPICVMAPETLECHTIQRAASFPNATVNYLILLISFSFHLIFYWITWMQNFVQKASLAITFCSLPSEEGVSDFIGSLVGHKNHFLYRLVNFLRRVFVWFYCCHCGKPFQSKWTQMNRNYLYINFSF